MGRIKAVLAKHGAWHVMKRALGTKEQITVSARANAAGDFMLPFLVFPGQKVTSGIGYRDFPDVYYTVTEIGWMDQDSFFEFIVYFDVFVSKLGIICPVILWIDGHTSHIGAANARFSCTNHIILFLLLQNATFVIQPFDVGIFSELKDGWMVSVCRWTITHFNELITKKNFPPIFSMHGKESPMTNLQLG